MSDPYVRLQLLKGWKRSKPKERKEIKMIDFRDLGFESEEEMAQYMEDEMESHLSVYNQINK